MLQVGAIKKVRGEEYRIEPMADDGIEAGTKICFKNGRTVRRILCMDGDEVVLRGCADAADVFEAVSADALTDQWYRLEPVA